VDANNSMSEKNKEQKNLVSEYPLISIIWGILNVIHAVGTFSNHACRCHVGHKWDVIGMCLIVYYLVLYNMGRILNRIRPIRNWLNQLVIIFFLLFLIGFIIIYSLSDLFYSDQHCEFREATMLGSLIVINFLLILYYERSHQIIINRKYFQIAFISLIGGFASHLMDKKKVFCNPISLYQGHSVWHLLTSSAMLSVYFYLRSEEAGPPSSKHV